MQRGHRRTQKTKWVGLCLLPERPTRSRSTMQARRVARFLLVALVFTAAAVNAEDESPLEDIDRTDFTDPALQSDEIRIGTVPHSDIEPAWIFPESPESKLHVGGTTDLLVALANGGAKMFNVSHVEGRLLDAAGKLVTRLPRFEYGQPLGPLEQRSFRYPVELDAEMALGEYKLVAKIFYNTRDKEPFMSLVLDSEPVELVPPLPSGDAQAKMLQAAVGVAVVLVLGLLGARTAAPADSKGKSSAAKKAKEGGNGGGNNEWLSGTLAGTETRSPKKTKKG